ncbi:putative galacturonosyltransferase 12 isoform X2 [Wolffia australiana]
MGEFIGEMKSSRPDATTFALNLKAMVSRIEGKARAAKIEGYLYRHVASSSIPKTLHCLSLTLAEEYSTNANARRDLPPPEISIALTDNSFYHFVLASDNVLAAAAVAASLVNSAARPSRSVLHVVTDKKAYAAMHAWFSLHPLEMVVEVKEMNQFEWFGKRKERVLEVMERDRKARVRFRGGPSAIWAASKGERPGDVAAKLQTLSPKYYSMMNHIRINLPEMFPSLKKVVFLDDDVIVQADLSRLWEIDLRGKVNGAVETCHGSDSFVMSKRLRNYLNFSHPLISSSFDPEECAWAYGMNIFDLEAWRKTNITRNYNLWVQKNVESGLSLWQLGTLPPALIAFHGHVHIIDHHWHMLGLGYQEKTSLKEAEKAAVIHYNGRAKPWLDIAFPHLRVLWTKHLNLSDTFLQACDIRAA